jgi:hypothetical protein
MRRQPKEWEPDMKNGAPARGRNAALLPQLPVNFEDVLGGLLNTPPPPKAEKPEKQRARKPKPASKPRNR